MAVVNRVVSPVQGAQIVAAAGTAKPLTADLGAQNANIYTKRVIIQAKKVGAENTGSVFIGDSNLDKTNAECIELTDRQTLELVAPEGECFNLGDIYVDADTSADSVVFLYVPMPS